MFKIRSCGEPDYLVEIFRKDNRNQRILIPNLDLRLAQKSFTIRGAKSWNQLPENIRQCPKIGIFKKLTRKWIVDNIPKFID